MKSDRVARRSMVKLDSSIVGHDREQADLLTALACGRIPHALLFHGPRGIGKRMVAQALARALLCEQPMDGGVACGHCRACRMARLGQHPDLVTFSRDKQTFSVELIRDEVMGWAARKPREGRRKIGILDDVEYFGPQAANAFLKTLEEPPPGTHWILLSSDLANTLATVRSRCQVLGFRPLGVAELRVLVDGPLQGPLAAALSRRGDETTKLEDEEREFALGAADGSPGRLLELVSEGFFSVRELLLAQLLGHQVFAVPAGRRSSGGVVPGLNSSTKTAVSPMEAAETLITMLSRESDETREALRGRLARSIGIARSLVRDLLALQCERRGHGDRGGESTLFNADRRDLLIQLAAVRNQDDLMETSDVLDKLERAVDSNGNLRIVATNLALSLA